MKKKLTLHRDTILNLDTMAGVQGGATSIQTQQVSVCVRCSGGGTCAFPCTLSPTACVPAACF